MVFGCFNLCRNLGIFKSGEEVVRWQKSFGAGGARREITECGSIWGFTCQVIACCDTMRGLWPSRPCEMYSS